jgi:hypothetical protein
MPGGNGVNRVDALQGIKTNLGFKMGTVLTAFFGHGDRFPDFGLTIRPVQLSGSTSGRGGRVVYRGGLETHKSLLRKYLYELRPPNTRSHFRTKPAEKWQ